MSEVRRFGVSIDAQLLDSFDFLIEQKRYMNRSEGDPGPDPRFAGGNQG